MIYVEGMQYAVKHQESGHTNIGPTAELRISASKERDNHCKQRNVGENEYVPTKLVRQ